MEQINSAVEDSIKLKEYIESKDIVKSFDDLKNSLVDIKLSEHWTHIIKNNKVMFLYVTSDNIPALLYSIVVDSSLLIRAYSQYDEVKVLKDYKFPCKLTKISGLKEVISNVEMHIKNPSISEVLSRDIQNLTSILNNLKNVLPLKTQHINFLLEQIDKLNINKNQYRYSPQFIILTSLLYSISPHAYKFLRGTNNVFLPYPETIHRICSSYDINPINEYSDEKFLGYIKQRFTTVKENEHIISLMLDEIHLKSVFDFKGGKICGMATDSGEPANSAHVFMVRSLLSDLQEVVHILPVCLILIVIF